MRFFSLPGSMSGAISAVGDREGALGFWMGKHLLATPDAVASFSVAAWSGTLADDGEFGADVRNWSVAAKSELHDKLDRLNAMADAKGLTGQFMLRPHARHILSDWHTCARFMAQRALAGDVRTCLLVDPAAMLTAQMIERSVEHLERVFEQVGLMLRDEEQRGRIGGVVLSNVQRPAGANQVDPLGYDEGEGLIACPLDDAAGVLDVKHLVRLAAAHLTTGTPVVFVGGTEAGRRQAELLG